MKIAIVYQYYQGHGAPGHSLVYEFSQYLANREHEVSVVSGETGYMDCAPPNYPWYRRIVRKSMDGKVEVVRGYTYSELHKSYFGRLLSFISFSLSCPLALLVIRKPDVVMASSPPIFPIFSAWLICKLRGIPFVIEVRDIWPESAVQMGILKNRFLTRIMSWMERVLYSQSVAIVALTEGIRDDIVSRGWPEEKVNLVTCGVDFDRLYPDDIGGKFICEKYGWVNHKIVLYFGAMGEANNLSVIVRAASRLSCRKDVLFVLVGNGMKRKETMEAIGELGLENIQILPAAPKNEARLYINAADICLVTLMDIPLFDGAVPTKLIDYMACGKPVVCGIKGEAAKIVNGAGAGVVFEPDNDEQLCETILDLLDSKEKAVEMGAGGLAYVSTHFSAEKLRQQAESILISVVEKKHQFETLKHGGKQ